MHAFLEAWQIVYPRILEYLPQGDHAMIAAFRRHFDANITENSPVTVFLPSRLNEGVISIALVLALVHIHNTFIERSVVLAQRTRPNSQIRVFRTRLQDVQASHVVSYDVGTDIIPTLLAHSKSSLKYAQGAHIVYDFAEIESRIIDLFIQGKHVLEIVGNFCVASSKQCLSASNFEKLRVIGQSPLPAATLRTMYQRAHALHAVDHCLRLLEKCISFIASTQPGPEASIREFLGHILLPQDDPFMVVLANQVHNNNIVRVEHIVNIWQWFDYSQATRVARGGQDAFDTIADAFKTQLSPECLRQLQTRIRNVNTMNLALELRENALLNLDLVDNIDAPLIDFIQACCENKGAAEVTTLHLLNSDGEHVSAVLKISQIVAVWNVVALNPRNALD
jgi:hypothetical protein